MTLGLFFWILMIIWFVTGFWSPTWSHWPTARNILLFLLLLALGWAEFGPPIRG